MHHQWLPDVLFAEPFALSADTQALLGQMGYNIEGQKGWGAVELIASGAFAHASMAEGATDSMAAHETGQAVYFGANDPRRPGGAALAP
jgi:gamma-glutamyltranspeptidase / glutathione hydrolase